MQILNWFVNWSMDHTGADHGAISMFLFIVPTNGQHLPVVELHTLMDLMYFNGKELQPRIIKKGGGLLRRYLYLY